MRNYFAVRFTEVGGPTLTVVENIPRTGVLGWMKKKTMSERRHLCPPASFLWMRHNQLFQVLADATSCRKTVLPITVTPNQPLLPGLLSLGITPFLHGPLSAIPDSEYSGVHRTLSVSSVLCTFHQGSLAILGLGFSFLCPWHVTNAAKTGPTAEFVCLLFFSRNARNTLQCSHT